MNKKIVIGSDHAGFELKEKLKTYLENKGCEVKDLGPSTDEHPVSYAIQGLRIAKEVAANKDELGIAVCGTGLGISFAVNRVKGIRGARITSKEDAEFAKKHNNANVLVFGGRQISDKQAIEMFETFDSNTFEGGRHEARLEDLDK